MLSRFAVPAFLVISGFLITQEEISNLDSTNKIVSRRIKKVMPPYFLWSTIYYILFLMTGEAFATHQSLPIIFIEKLFTGTVTFHLFFLIMIAQCYVLCFFGIGRGGHVGKFVLISSIALQLSFIFLSYLAEIGPYFGPKVSYTLRFFQAYCRSFFPMFICFFMFGRWMGANYEKILELAKYKKYIFFFVIISFLLGLFEFLFLKEKINGIILLPQDWTLTTNIFAFAMIIFLLLHLRSLKQPKVDAVLIWAAKFSFILYLLHEPLLGYIVKNVYHGFPMLAKSQIVFQPIILVSGITMSVLIYKLISICIPSYAKKYLFG